MPTLDSPIAPLGAGAPALAPWFPGVNLVLPQPKPADRLGLPLQMPAGAANVEWHPPASGTLSLFVCAPGRLPAPLRDLEDSEGNSPFDRHCLVALFRLLPEVEARLEALLALLPPLAGAAGAITGPTRATPRCFALALDAPAGANPAGIWTAGAALTLFTDPAGNIGLPGPTNADRLRSIGLTVTAGTLANMPLPAHWLRRSDGNNAARDRILRNIETAAAQTLWCFDKRGRPIEPGAVAAWFSWLLVTGVGAPAGGGPLQLLPANATPADYPATSGQPEVVPVQAGLSVHLVDAHEGPLGPPFLTPDPANARLRVGAAAPFAAPTDRLLVETGGQPVGLSFTAAPAAGPVPENPAPDDAPRPRIAVLPGLAYAAVGAAPLVLFGAGQQPFARDFARVAVTDEERLLTGLGRQDCSLWNSTPEAMRTATLRRETHQNRPSTRITVARTANAAPVLVPNAGQTAALMLGLPGATPRRFVLGMADASWGAPPAFGVGPFPTLPTALTDAGAAAPGANQYRVRALLGGGASPADQLALLEVNFTGTGNGAGFVGLWLRAWPTTLGDDGHRRRLAGGAGRVGADGIARLVLPLPPGQMVTAAPLGFDLLMLPPGATRAGAVELADLRFNRPAPLAGAPRGLPGASDAWHVCETGQSQLGWPQPPALPPLGVLPAGGHLIVEQADGHAALVAPAAIPRLAWSLNTLGATVLPTDAVSLCEPAWPRTPDRLDAAGRPRPAGTPGLPANAELGRLDVMATSAQRIHRLERGALPDGVGGKFVERLDIGASAPGAAGGPLAVLGSAPAMPWAMSPTAGFDLGMAGAPASVEVHGTGASLSGPPALALDECLRDRTAGLVTTEFSGLTGTARDALLLGEPALAWDVASQPSPVVAEGAGAGPVVAVLRTIAPGVTGEPGLSALLSNTAAFPIAGQVSALENWLNATFTGLPMLPASFGTWLKNQAQPVLNEIVRALDRRFAAALDGAREGAVAMLAAIDRAQDFIYLETPALDTHAVTEPGGPLDFTGRLAARLQARPRLRLAICVPQLLLPGTPRALQALRDDGLARALAQLRAAAPGRVAVFMPATAVGRGLRFASTTVVVDDVVAFTGSTHPWRRGLAWDSSLMAAVFDERVADGRPVDVANFRRRLMADRLGITVGQLPGDAAELVRAIVALDRRGTPALLSTPIRPAAVQPDASQWQPDPLAAGGGLGGALLDALKGLYAAQTLTETVDAD
ncbi:hypothetical protein [Derxia gummosa]|uniref:Uncharacterized protein n=1 Tax=Derxia gummosa DSM 723 TaxID=1121388 RepID=A0A8B6X3C8_9BURK|nr:hypothetical protein [Derxia gummosa]